MSIKTFLLCLVAAVGIAQTGQFLMKKTPVSMKTGKARPETGPSRPGGAGAWKPILSARSLKKRWPPPPSGPGRPEKLHLTLDRTLLAPGDDLWFTCWLRNADDLAPSRTSDIVHVELLDPRGFVIAQKTLLSLGGLAAGDLRFDQKWPGGQYRIRAFTNWMKNTGEAFERDLTLQKTVLPNLRLKLDFERKSFGPGEVVIAKFDAHSLENRPLSGKKIDFSVKIGGADFQQGPTATDAEGLDAYVRFELPKDLSTNDALLNITLENNGQTEAISRAVPIVLGKIDLQFFPEGGDAVAGISQKMAFKAVNEFGKPADVAGEIFDSKNGRVAVFSSFHDGMGAVSFTPKAGESYCAKLTSPANCPTVFPLPAAAENGLSLHLLEKKGDDLVFEVRSTRAAEKVYFTGVGRDKLLIFNELNLTGGPVKVFVPTADWPMGIARFTLFDQKMAEQAERLTFTGRGRQLKIDLSTDREKYLPRDRVQVEISVKDDRGRPVMGQFALAVSDDKLLTFADDKQGNLLAEMMLQSDVKGEIEEPNFYFDPAEKDAEQALDNLLMTQGWRRFGWKTTLASEPLVFQNQPERARIAGKLTDFDEKRPMTRAKLTLYPDGPAVRTDRTGRFDFGTVDIQRYSHIQFGKWSFFPLENFDENLDLAYLEKGRMDELHGIALRTEPSAGGTFLAGRVTEPTGGAFGTTIKVMQGTSLVAGAQTDFDGNYSIKLKPGSYDIVFSYVGWHSQKITGITVREDQKTIVDKGFGPADMGASLCESVVVSKKSLAQSNDLQKGERAKKPALLTADEIRKAPTQSVNAIVATTAGVAAIDGGDVAIRGSRDDAPNYYIDGIRVPGNNLPPVQDIDQLEVSTGSLGAEFENWGNAALSEIVVTAYSVPLIQQDMTTQGQTFSGSDLSPAFRTVMSQPLSGGYYPAKPKKRPNIPNRRLAYQRARQFYAPNYHHQPAPERRDDFRPTIFWSPNVETDEQGRALVQFCTSDALTTFKISAEGIGANGQLGRAEHRFFAQKPVQLDCKLPAQVLTGDVLRLPVMLKNNSAKPVSGKLTAALPDHFLVKNNWPETIELAAGEAKTIEIACEIGLAPVPVTNLQIGFSTKNGLSDAVQTVIKTSPRGFPVTQVFSGNSAQNRIDLRLVNPIDGTVSAKIAAYPSVLEDLTASMERMLRQPSGCFEQVSSSNYPNLLVLDFLKKTGQLRPDIESKARAMLADGYQKLTGYESKSGGFDWYGRDPGHEGLTAYGILEFTDMARVFPVDEKMVARTADWLLSRRDGKGGWKQNPKALHSWGVAEAQNAYITWCLAEAGFGGKIGPEIDATLKKAVETGDIYQQAMLANALLKLGDDRSKPLISSLLKKTMDDGGLPGTGQTAMGGYGNSLRIETTSLLALALMRANSNEGAQKKAVDFILKNKTEFGYGSTQTTVFALRALIEYAAKSTEKTGGGQLVVTVDGNRVAEESFAAGQLNPLTINGLEKFFKNAEPRIEVFFEKTGKPLPFDFELKYSASQPRNAEGCPLVLTTILEKNTVKIGETVRLTASVLNDQKDAAASPMLIVGIPAGLSLQPWQLKKLGDEKAFDFYELWDGFAVFHFEKLEAGERRDIALDLRAEIPGRFEARASQAFLYYSNEMRVFSRPEAVVLF